MTRLLQLDGTVNRLAGSKTGLRAGAQVRVLVLGVIPGYRHMGIDGLLYLESFREGIRKGYKRGEFSWLLEDNEAIMRPLEALGAKRYKTYRVYDLPL